MKRSRFLKKLIVCGTLLLNGCDTMSRYDVKRDKQSMVGELLHARKTVADRFSEDMKFILIVSILYGRF